MARTPTVDGFRKKLEDLARRFKSQESFYLSNEYNESQARLDFIDPFFSALGWDLSNSKNVPYHRREVIIERGDSTNRDRPDYAFRVNGRIRFFVEAKAPHEPMDNIYHVHQAKSYAWSSPDADVAILTDFEEIKIFDCRAVPEINSPQKGLIKAIKYTDFAENAEFLWELSKPRVYEGSLEKLLEESEVSIRHRIRVDKQFLKHIMEWRLKFAKAIYRDNEIDDPKELDKTVDVIINRIVFLRVAEDREILTRPTLISMTATWAESEAFNLWEKLIEHFEGINEDLNGILFKNSRDFAPLEVDERLIHDFVMSLYFPNSPYRFDEIPIELLGTIYEQYLGKQFEKSGRTVALVDKPEVRKAGGIFYTPQNIVNTIVENTFSKLSRGKKYSEISRLAILDPACGSGSFLITAFGRLMEYHLDYLLKNPKDVTQGRFFPDIVKDDRGEWKLSIEKKRDILQNNIFGVDIDSQAVGICAMSLYLKALEGEQRLPNRKSLLPTLDKNIKCGNSLVSGTTRELQSLIGEDYVARRPFNWELNFTKIMRDKGGFDLVAMNPPYVKIQKMMEDATNDVRFLQEKYKTANEGSADIYVAFIEKSLSLLSPKGFMGLICPHKFFQAEYGAELRTLLSEMRYLYELVSFGDIQIFEGASTYTCLLYCTKNPTERIKFTKVKSPEALNNGLQLSLEFDKEFENEGVVIDFVKSRDLLVQSEWNFVVGKEREPFELLAARTSTLVGIADKIYQGVISGADDVFILDGNVNPQKKTQRLRSRELGKEVEIETSILRPIMQGFSDIKPFSINKPTAHIILPYNENRGETRLFTQSEMRKSFPSTWDYLKRNKAKLEARERGRWAGENFHCYSRNQNLLRFQKEKIMMPYMVNKLTAFFDPSNQYYFVNVTTGGYGLTLKSDAPISYLYLSGLLNSHVLNFYLKKIGSNFRGGFFPCSTQFLNKLPIVIPTSKEERRVAQKIEGLMEAVTKRLHSGREMGATEVFENQTELDKLVSELYQVAKFIDTLKAA